MGVSVILAQFENFEVAIDIDYKVTLEMGTGFTGSGVPSVNITIPLSQDSLEQLIKNATEVFEKLKTSKRCEMIYFESKMQLNPDRWITRERSSVG